MSVEIITADCLDALPRLAADGFRAHAVVTDPPYELGFMGKAWDQTGVAFRPETWTAVRECMLPGAHLVAFSGTRTSHRMVCAIEDAGFEIRDTLMWVYGSGFPKSLDVSKAMDRAAGAEREVVGQKGGRYAYEKQDFRGGALHSGADTQRTAMFGDITAPATPEAAAWSGWGTALKPSYEPIILARKPLSEGSVAANVLRHGTGAINVDASRIPGARPDTTRGTNGSGTSYTLGAQGRIVDDGAGRWPSNLLHDGSPEVEQAFGTSQSTDRPRHNTAAAHNRTASMGASAADWTTGGHNDSGSPSRFFYATKADATDRQGSRHPTVKPASLMRWLVRLVCPPGGTVLDPFAGTGSTGLAADQLGMNAVLIERDAQYAADARRKIERDGGLFADVRELCQMAVEPAMRDLFAEAAD